ncbi:MAG: hypothetical protein K1Y36_26145 [Blastocatellia bacterium]|nr:hypothetical protein [Blastocatellia bacterium]
MKTLFGMLLVGSLLAIWADNLPLATASARLQEKPESPAPIPLLLFPVQPKTRLPFQTLEGTAAPGSQVTFKTGNQQVTTTTTNDSGLFTVNLDLAPGPNLITFSATDEQGKYLPPKQLTIISEPKAPLPPADGPYQINWASGAAQSGLVDSELPQPLVALVTDSGGQPVSNVPVTFQAVHQGGWFSNRLPQITVKTDRHGHAEARYQVGSKAGIQLVRATFDGNMLSPTVFLVNAKASSDNQTTWLHGALTDNYNRPLENVVVRVGKQEVRTASDGRFNFEKPPTGPQICEVLGDSHQKYPGRWPGVMKFPVTILPGVYNLTHRPFTVPKLHDGIALPLDSSGRITQDTTYIVPRIDTNPSIEVVIRAGTRVTFPASVSDRRLSITQLSDDNVPFGLDEGRASKLFFLVEPAGVTFDRPLEITAPNLDKLPVGMKLLLARYDEAAHRYLAAGTGLVVNPGTVQSDDRKGILQAGWYALTPIAPAPESTSIGYINGTRFCNCLVHEGPHPALPIGIKREKRDDEPISLIVFMARFPSWEKPTNQSPKLLH